VSFFDDPDINYKIPWALRNISGKSAIEGLIRALRSPSPQVRVFAIQGLEDLEAGEALPDLLPLLSDHAMSSYDRRGYVSKGSPLVRRRVPPSPRCSAHPIRHVNRNSLILRNPHAETSWTKTGDVPLSSGIVVAKWRLRKLANQTEPAKVHLSGNAVFRPNAAFGTVSLRITCWLKARLATAGRMVAASAEIQRGG